MTLTVCVSDYWQHRHYFNQQPANSPVRRLSLQLDAITANYLLRELLQQKVLAQKLQQNDGVELLWLALSPPERDTIDYKWGEMLRHTIWEHVEVEHLMSWLSTLGGGFSALGEQFERCAETAGKISLQQLTIGLRLGDPFLQARCKLYYSISLIQRGQLRQAKHLIRSQHRFALQFKEYDQRLMRMCLGIWLRLRFEYEERRSRRCRQSAGHSQ
ncbi:uncharacterized protein F58A4.6 [Drosophila albomicans]|uniref:Uncharacterized protein F58A4.6 n=2 Tax=nasuta subgroup TaxID=32307 RepID=A0A6P8Y1D2_DROAB|nr:uncharacterized protein F58A4.6 [Drosophila albomicans]